MDKTRRAFIIYDLIKRNKAKNRKEIRRVLLDEFDDLTTITSISRSINHLVNDFNIQIEYDFKNEEYEIVNENFLNESFENYLKSLDYKLYVLGLHNNPNFEKYILYDKRKNTSDSSITDILSTILIAIENRVVIEFIYKKYMSNDNMTIILNPYYLKEYQLNWYVEGYLTETKDRRTFGLDRIMGLKLRSENSFVRDDNYENHYQKHIGIDSNGIFKPNRSEKIRLQLNPFFSNFVTNNPIHFSQKLIKTDKKGFSIFEFEIVINNELIGEIMRMDKGCKVLGPKKLVDYIKKLLGEMSSQYSVNTSIS